MQQNYLSCYILLFSCAIVWSACGNEGADDNSNDQSTEMTAEPVSEESTASETTELEPFIAEDELYAWVDNLNIRDAPKLDGKVVAKVDTRAALRFTGERSETTETIVLRGVAYREPWLKVITPDGTAGWVFGGAVKHEDEVKGNAPITEQTFSFPVFGTYNLAEWEKVSSRREGEEVDYTVTTYRQGDQWLEISQSEMGEFYYGWTYKLMREDKVLIKERQFGFTAQGAPFTLEEKVVDYSVNPPVSYRRTQELDQHYYQLNARPMMVRGPWEKTSLARIPDQVQLGPLSFSDCSKIAEEDSGCSCTFKRQNTGDYLFISDMDDDACLSIDGAVNALLFAGSPYREELLAKSRMKAWLSLDRDGSVRLFEEPVGMGDSERIVDELVDVLLVMDRVPSEVPVENRGYQGMAIRELRDMGNDALQTARERIRQGQMTLRMMRQFKNERYIVSIQAKPTTFYEGEANQYQGTLQVKAVNGKVLATEPVSGSCGC